MKIEFYSQKLHMTYFDTVVVEVCDGNVTFAVHCSKVWSSKLEVICATAPKFGEKLPGLLEDTHTRCLVVHHYYVAIVVHTHALWTCNTYVHVITIGYLLSKKLKSFCSAPT